MKIRPWMLKLISFSLAVGIVGLLGCGRVDYRPIVKVESFNSTLHKKFGTAVDFMPAEKRNYRYQYLCWTAQGYMFRNPEVRNYLKDHPASGNYPGDAVLKSSIGGAGSIALYIASDNLVPDPRYLRTE